MPVHNLLCVLDWGLGHASRSLALADQLRSAGQTVSWAAAGPALTMLRRERPGETLHELPAYAVRYYGDNMVWNVARQLTKWARVIRAERRAVARIVAGGGIDRIISDSRFGCRHPAVRSVFMTHQLRPITGFAPADWVYHHLLARFDEHWVPDEQGPDGRGLLSGRLSDPSGFPDVKFIGPLSRLPAGETAGAVDVLLLLSGPEPARTRFEYRLIRRFAASGRSVVLVRGLPADRSAPAVPAHWRVLPYADAPTLSGLLATAGLIVCRSGYSTLMDLRQLGRTAELHPTPGQTEQLYLAERWREMDHSPSSSSARRMRR